VQDILIVYTQAAAKKAGGEAAIQAAARDTVARTNKAYLDSGINLRQRVLNVWQVSHFLILATFCFMRVQHCVMHQMSKPLPKQCVNNNGACHISNVM
jgi:hypothetical protein